MIRYYVLYSSRAIEDLANIFRYIAYIKLEPNKATNLVNQIKNAIETLNTLPFRHPHFKTLKASKRVLRKYVIKGHAILYEINEFNKIVTVVAIVNCRRDLDKLIN